MESFKYMVELFVENVCDILQIDEPIMSYDESKMHTPTMLAVADVKNNIVYVKHTKQSALALFSIAHEIRHIYQFQTDMFDFEKYTRSDGIDIVSYNSQPMELDAHAFACAVMEETYGLEIDLRNLGRENVKKIEEAKEKIKASYII